MNGHIQKFIKIKTRKSAVLAVLVIFAFLAVNGAKSKNRAFYSGDAIVYQNQLYVGSTNMGALELFRLDGNVLNKIVKFESSEARYGGWDPFYDLSFSQEAGILYVYLVDGRYLYKYDLSTPAQPSLVSKIKDNSYDWLLGVKKFENRIVTVGTKGVKVWDPGLQVLDTFRLENKLQYNLNFDSSGEFIFNVGSSSLEIFDTKLRLDRVAVPLSINEEHNRKTFADQTNGKIYLVDDRRLRQFDYDGQEGRNFEHIGRFGYEVDGIPGSDHLYMSDGIGIVKVRKADMAPVDWVYTDSLGAPGGWAMGLNVVRGSGGEKIVVFNNSSILVFNESLDLIASADAYGEDLNPIEPLGLAVDRSRAPVNSSISLSGSGFGLGEQLSIDFAGTTTVAYADEKGRFSQILTVPAVAPPAPRWVDINVSGVSSKQHYMISFYIE